MKEFNLYNKIKELQETDKDIEDTESQITALRMSPYYAAFSNEYERQLDVDKKTVYLYTLKAIRKEILTQISIFSKREAEKTNSVICSN